MFYKLSENNLIECCTTDEKIAKSLGLIETTKEIITGFDGKLYFKGKEPKMPEPTYSEKRQKEYPPINEQLDMIYWDKVNNTNVWQSKIAEIKSKFPKE